VTSVLYTTFTYYYFLSNHNILGYSFSGARAYISTIVICIKESLLNYFVGLDEQQRCGVELGCEMSVDQLKLEQ